MSIDLLLKPTCGGCGSTTDLYGSNCKHMTLCLTCGKTMAENKAKCFDCGVTVTRLIRVRSLFPFSFLLSFRWLPVLVFFFWIGNEFNGWHYNFQFIPVMWFKLWIRLVRTRVPHSCFWKRGINVIFILFFCDRNIAFALALAVTNITSLGDLYLVCLTFRRRKVLKTSGSCRRRDYRAAKLPMLCGYRTYQPICNYWFHFYIFHRDCLSLSMSESSAWVPYFIMAKIFPRNVVNMLVMWWILGNAWLLLNCDGSLYFYFLNKLLVALHRRSTRTNHGSWRTKLVSLNSRVISKVHSQLRITCSWWKERSLLPFLLVLGMLVVLKMRILFFCNRDVPMFISA